MHPADIAVSYAGRTNLTVRSFGHDHDDPQVLLEGDKTTLLMLADLIRAVAEGKADNFGISPTGAGSVHFGRGAQMGLYISRRG
ncbi:hypothetical protein ACFSM5_20840 [Lacibacterium aquatile]|uniref:Uncharacterized protein n=1 Tax=Lacibacterium aquatile TaxID=1168082 RepID=A0ABW5DZZ6_9PROT